MKKFLMLFAVILLVLAFPTKDFAVTRTSSQTGLWNSTSTWGGASVPTTGDDAFISAGHTVTLDISPTVTNCTVNGTGILDASTFTLTVSGTFTLASGATFKQGGVVQTVPGTIRTFNPASTFIFNGSQTGITDFVAFGNLTWSSSAAALLNGDLSLGGTLTVNGTNELRGSVGTVATTHTIAGNVVISGASAVLSGTGGTTPGSATWNIAGNVTTTAGGTLRGLGGSTSANAFFNIGGNYINDGAFDIGTASGTVTLTFNGSSSQNVTGVQVDAQDIVINNSAGVTFTANVSTYTTLTLQNGTLTNTTHLILFGGGGTTIVRSGGTLATAPTFPPGINVKYTASVTTGNELPTATGDLGDLIINASGGVTLGAPTTVNGTLIFSTGKLTLGANNLTLAPGIPITGASSSNYIVTNSTGYMIRNVASSNVAFPIGTASTYNPVILNNTGGTADNYSVRVASSTSNVVAASGVVGDQWTINESIDGGSNITMTLQWNGAEEEPSFTSSRSSGKIGRWSGSGTNWAVLTTSAPSGSDPWTAQVTGMNVAGIFQNTVYGVGLAAALPVELTSFTVIARSGKVELAWATATEINNYGFEVERKSVNSDQLTVNSWEKIGFIEGHGSTNAPQDYSFTDAAARVGKYSYRLKQIDRDGKFQHHQAVEITLGITPNTVWLDNNYPNPFNPSTKISFVLGTTGNASLKVFDLLGKEVVTLADGVFNSGELQSFTFDASKYSSGIYYYQLKSGAQTEIKKMLLLK